MEFQTKYGTVSGRVYELFPDTGKLKSLIADEETFLDTPYGKFVPNFSCAEPRKKYRSSVELYDNGNLRSVYLEEQAAVMTPVGILPAEHITFYEEGGIRRLFPLYGQLNGYWTEENEYELAPQLYLPILGEQICCKPLCIHFYPGGALYSVTIWNRSSITVKTLYGPVTTRFGLSFYEDGKLKSIEPVFRTVLQTPSGTMFPYDPNHALFHADNNSLQFDREGNIIGAKSYRQMSHDGGVPKNTAAQGKDPRSN